jgi:N-glycosylase/DNA lyase
VDSRIKKIFFEETKKKKVSDSQIREYFNYLAQKLNIPPLHLDSLLWVEV